MNTPRKLEAWTSAFKAGWIAHRCQSGCVVDNIKEEIVPCSKHSDEIARLAAINLKSQ